MTTLKKNTLAFALVAAMGFAANASAFSVTTNGDTSAEKVATFDIASASTVITTGESLEISLDNSATESILGRTTGFNIVITLTNGAKFNVTPTADTGTVTATFDAANNTWSGATIAGGAGQNFVTIKMDPASTPVGLVPGGLVRFASEDLINLTALQTANQTVSANVQIVDPVGGGDFGTVTGKILTSGDPNWLSCDSTAGDTAKKIDVGTGIPAGTYASKTTFSPTGAINYGGVSTFNAGEITVDANPDFASFTYLAGDTFETVLTGTSFAAFASGSVTMVSDCGGADIVGTVSADGTTVTFDYAYADLGSATGGCWHVVFDNSSAETIDATAISAETTFTRGSFTSSNSDPTNGYPNPCDLLPMAYNGSVVKVATFNPAGNTSQQSFLRITNPGNVAGAVRIEGTDDAGVAGTPVTLMLGAGESVQINSDVLEAGGVASGNHALSNGLGDGTGKWRLLVNGEFYGMRVQSLNRNNSSGTVTNLTDYDTSNEQTNILPIPTPNGTDY